MMLSNIPLLLPVIASVYRGQWLYGVFAIALCISSPLYHWLNYRFLDSQWLPLVRNVDWVVAGGAYIYMFIFLATKTLPEYRLILGIALIATLMLFAYGFWFGDYNRIHPWFHILAPIVSALIVYNS